MVVVPRADNIMVYCTHLTSYYLQISAQISAQMCRQGGGKDICADISRYLQISLLVKRKVTIVTLSPSYLEGK
jgi:hypothetical protein